MAPPCRRIDALLAHSNLETLVVVLVRPRNPLNIGAAARAMSNFGARQLRLVNPYAIAFREARSAVGASQLLKNAEEFGTVAKAAADCNLIVGTTAVRNRALKHPLRQLDAESGAAIQSDLQAGRVALLFGSEKTGLTNEDFSYCHWLLNIPTAASHISMNLGQAVAVCLYEIARSSPTSSSAEESPHANVGDVEKITEVLLESLHQSGYVKPGNEAMCEKKTRSLILRLGLSSTDAKILLGMVRQILWKLRQRGGD